MGFSTEMRVSREIRVMQNVAYPSSQAPFSVLTSDAETVPFVSAATQYPHVRMSRNFLNSCGRAWRECRDLGPHLGDLDVAAKVVHSGAPYLAVLSKDPAESYTISEASCWAFHLLVLFS